MVMLSKFLPTGGFKWIDTKTFDSNKYNSNSWHGCVLEVDLEYPKELRELHNFYPLASDKMEMKKEISNYVKTLVPNFFDKEKY